MHKKRIAMASWEIGYAHTKLGTRVGGMGLVLQELPIEMAKYAESRKKEVEIEVLSPCFGSYDRSQLYYEGALWVPHFDLEFEVFSHVFEDCKGLKIKHIYFWNESVLGDIKGEPEPQEIYPSNDWDALRVYTRVSAAMATYLTITGCYALHLHDYHVGFVPFYLDFEAIGNPSIVFTIHNATYQGWLSIWNDPAPVMYEISMPLECYRRYFQYWGNFNSMKGILLRMPEIDGAVTTVSEGYAGELNWSEQKIREIASQEGCPPPKKIFVPNNYLSELAWANIVGVNNGLSKSNAPEHLKFLKPEVLRDIQSRQHRPLFNHPIVQERMLGENHNYSLSDMSNREILKTLAHLECFNMVPEKHDVMICMVGRLDKQKNFEILLGIVHPLIQRHPNLRFVIIASPKKRDEYGMKVRDRLRGLADNSPNNIYYYDGFNEPLSKLVLAASHFCLVPSVFEPCGLIDYEAALLGCIPIVRKTGGLTKTFPYSFGYPWYDQDDYWGEANRLAKVIDYAVTEYHDNDDVYQKRVKGCMGLDTSWEGSVERYFKLLKI